MVRLAGCVAAALLCGGAVALVDENENCAGWASAGECTAVSFTFFYHFPTLKPRLTWSLPSPSHQNPGYMSVSCQKSCAEVEASAAAVADSFYDLSAQDVDGRWIDFGSYYKDRVVLITNGGVATAGSSHPSLPPTHRPLPPITQSRANEAQPRVTTRS